MKKNPRKIIERLPLSKILPLETPLSMQVDVSSACNFKCKFCFHGLPKEELERTGFVPRIMDYNMFVQIIDKMKSFPSKVKRLSLIRDGEPLLNKNLAKMISYAKAANVAERIGIATNGSLFLPSPTVRSPEHSIAADILDTEALDEVLISVEALSSEGYKEICGCGIDFEQLVSGVSYFYKNRGNCKVYIKIVDIALKDSSDEKRFYDIFENISDAASVEHIVPFYPKVNYDSMIRDKGVNLIGLKNNYINVCSEIFFRMHITPNGNISVCCADYSDNFVMGNASIDSLYEVWNGEKMNELRTLHLKGERFKHEHCSKCSSEVLYITEDDILDDDAELLLKYYDKSIKNSCKRGRKEGMHK